MKLNCILIFFLVCSFGTYSQSEILDSIRNVQLKQNPELGKSLCTSGFWIADSDGGIGFFGLISELPEDVELKLNKEQKNENRAVLTTDIYFKGVLAPNDRLFVFLIKKSNFWLIDGINETEELIEHFLGGYYSGHFTPYDLPRDTGLEEFGNKLISHSGNNDELLKYLRENTAHGSKFDFISDMESDENYEPYFFIVYGYDKRINKGYINFWAHPKDKESPYVSNITIYVSKTENGKIKILGQSFYGPSKYDFFSIK